MSTATISCPYCNSCVSAPAAGTPRVHCPRCGESFPYRVSSDPINGSVPAGSPVLPPPAVAAPSAPQRWSNRRLALTLIGGMGLMALMSLTFALSTVEFRRQNDPRPLPEAPPPPVAVPPAEWPALAYLPKGCNLVVGFQVARLQETPAGRAFLARADLGKLGTGIAEIEQATGLSRDQLDHVVFGVRLDGLRMLLVARTRQPYDKKRLWDALKAKRRETVEQREVYHFELARQNWPLVLWSPDSTTLVIGQHVKDIAAIPYPPETVERQLPAPLEAMLKERTGPQDLVWLAGHADRLDVLALFLGPNVPEETKTALLGLRTFVLSVRPGKELELSGKVACADDKAAAALEKVLAKVKASDGAYLKLLGSSPEGDKVAKELAESFQVKREGTVLTIAAKASEATVAQAVGK